MAPQHNVAAPYHLAPQQLPAWQPVTRTASVAKWWAHAAAPPALAPQRRIQPAAQPFSLPPPSFRIDTRSCSSTGDSPPPLPDARAAAAHEHRRRPPPPVHRPLLLLSSCCSPPCSRPRRPLAATRAARHRPHTPEWLAAKPSSVLLHLLGPNPCRIAR